MWRWVTRCLVLTLLALFAPALLAQLTFTGDVDAPDVSRTHSGVVLVKGWALDPNSISKIELWVDDRFQHDALMFQPRIEIIQAFPDWPGIHNLRPGFITGFVANRFSNGPHTVEIRVLTSDGGVHFLGRRTININNTINQAPFGFTDIPDGKGVYNVSGAFPVNGWAADTDGIQRIEVLVDDTIVGGAMHGDPRPDVGATFPDFTGAMFSGFVANVDSTAIQNGVHVLTVRAVDRLGMSNLIGRRTVQVINNDINLKPFGYIDEPLRDAIVFATGCDDDEIIISPPVRPNEHITPVRGWALDLGTRGATGRVSWVELLVDGVPWLDTANDCGVVLGRFANCYGLPRYDVQRYYPTFPDAPRAGFLFTLDAGALIRLGVLQGSHRLSVRVGDQEQTFAELPNRDGIPVFFQCVQSPFNFAGFGFIEFPNSSDYIGGTVLFRGWALEDQGNSVAAVEVIIDGNYVGQAQYGFPRTDVADQYPHVLNSINSGWQFTMDTRMLTNARHRLTVRTVDSRGARTEIGSIDFYVSNGNTQP